MSDGVGQEDPRKGELASGLADLRRSAGLPGTEDEACQARIVRVTLPIDDVVVKIAGYLRSGEFGLYRRGHEVGTIDEGTGEWAVMNARRFRTWLPQCCGILPIQKFMRSEPREDDADAKPVFKPIKGELTLDQAATILCSDELMTKLPVVEHIHRVKLPVLRALKPGEDQRRLELLQPGYDKEARTFTVRGALDYDESMEVNDGIKFLESLLRYFPWADAPGRGRLCSRSVAIQVAAMLTVFCARMFRGRSPLFLWNANKPDSGKSRLAQLVLQPVFGHAGRSGFSYKDKKEVKQELDAVAQIFGPYIFFDDLPRGKVTSEDLHRWLTAPEWSCRILGTKERFHGPLFASTLMTGNEIKVGEDLERRTLQVDLFAKVAGVDRVLPEDAVMLDDDFFAREEMMGRVLSALWALVREWDGQGRPGTRRRPLNSFEGWSRVAPAIAECTGWGDALAPFDAPDSGNEEGRELKRLMVLVLRELAPPRPVDLPAEEDHVSEIALSEVTALARRERFFQERLLTVDAILAEEGERGGFKWTPLDAEGMKVWEERVRAELEARAEAGEDLDPLFGISDLAKDAARRWAAARWHGQKIGAWWGKFFKKRAANGLYWMSEDGERFEVGSRESNDLSKVVLRRMGRRA